MLGNIRYMWNIVRQCVGIVADRFVQRHCLIKDLMKEPALFKKSTIYYMRTPHPKQSPLPDPPSQNRAIAYLQD